MKLDLMPLIVGLIGAGGLGAFFREIASAISKVVGGMSARESNRKVDIVKQRDVAIAREEKAWRLVDAEAEKRRVEQEYSARLQRQLILAGIEPFPEPVHETTITKSQLKELREKEEV